ncbi:LysR family transcriptional regulator [Actinomycetospora atypica]|uniref:LysR family transcriptional regulator n=1 Tax=Actinomycetospora atypica TaxID=1290095 RepID=A0ABV9YLS1_9PSEU
MELTLVGLRVLRETAERGTFTAGAQALGYTQSAVSRQVAALERAVGTPVFERRPDGLRLTRAGRVLLRRARTALDELDLAAREIDDRQGSRRARIGVVPSAGIALLPRVLAVLARTTPELEVSSRVATTPALVRAVRAGTLDLAVVTSRPPHRPLDPESPALVVETLGESGLLVAVALDGPLGERNALTVDDLAGHPWIATPSRSDEPQLGVWPSLPGRPRVLHTAADWATKLALVAAGAGLTTVTPLIVPALPAGVRALPVLDGPAEVRRSVAVRLPDADLHPGLVEAFVEVLDDPASATGP